MTPAPAATRSIEAHRPRVSGSEWLVRVSLLSLAALTSAYLLPFWRESAELSHGFFAPLCAWLLLRHSRLEPDLADSWPRGLARVLPWLLAAAGVATGWTAAMAALAQGPMHTQTAFLAGIALSLVVVSGVCALARMPSRWVRLNGASLCAAALWWFAVPLPRGTLARLTLFLQDKVTGVSLQALHLLGIPAARHGNVLELSTQFVGVEEACSGIRSLTACLFVGVVIGGLMLRGFVRRGALVTAAAVIAVASNLMRSILLCVLAARGVDIGGFWHDATAYAVLGVTALVLYGGCRLLESSPPAPATTSAEPIRKPGARTAFTLHAGLAGILASLTVLVIVKTAPDARADQPPPDLQALLALESPGWIHRADDSIFAFSRALNTPYLRQDSYFRGEIQLTFYIAFWPAGQSTLGSVGLHSPDVCLPGTGWQSQPPPAPADAYPLPATQRFSFERNQYPQHVWFWHFFNGRPVEQLSGLYPWQLGPRLLGPGVKASAPQWVVRISSNRPLEALLEEPILREFFGRLRTAGLTQ